MRTESDKNLEHTNGTVYFSGPYQKFVKDEPTGYKRKTLEEWKKENREVSITQERKAKIDISMFDKSEYEKSIKHVCYRCYAKIDNSWEYYWIFGNMCQMCNAEVLAKMKTEEAKSFRSQFRNVFEIK
jgi:hypothetical protein